MSELRTVAVQVVEEAQSLVQQIDEFQSPPSRAQIDVVQDRMNRLQRLCSIGCRPRPTHGQRRRGQFRLLGPWD